MNIVLLFFLGGGGGSVTFKSPPPSFFPPKGGVGWVIYEGRDTRSSGGREVEYIDQGSRFSTV